MKLFIVLALNIREFKYYIQDIVKHPSRVSFSKCEVVDQDGNIYRMINDINQIRGLKFDGVYRVGNFFEIQNLDAVEQEIMIRSACR